MQIHLVSGFLGSGKTTGIRTACGVLLSEGYKVGVITNDQGIRLVDTGYFESISIPNRQVVDGCFCCNYNALDTHIQSLVEVNNPDVIFAESVGSCTDIVATVMKPLQRFHNDIEVTVSTFADARLLHMLYADKKPLFADEVAYIYQKQLEEASIVVVTKTDLVSESQITAVQDYLHHQYPGKKVIYMNGTSKESIADWLTAISQASDITSLPSLQINYDTYGAGEAVLAWLDEEVELYSSSNATEEAASLARQIYQAVSDARLSIGHIKFLIDDTIKLSYTATTQPAEPAQYPHSSNATMLINARVQTTPDTLQSMVADCIKKAEHDNNCKIVINSLASFRPGYPSPTYRMAD